MNHSLAQLRKMIAHRDARIATLKRQLADARAGRWQRGRDIENDPDAVLDRCEECGAEAGERCILPDGSPYKRGARQHHHLRGRVNHCARANCPECARAFGDHREITSPGSGT